jgi:spermidine synthase
VTATTLRPPPDPLGPDAYAEDESAAQAQRRRVALLFVNVFIVAMCGLVYELLAGAAASYLLGDSVTQFSLVIGVYLSAMGLGAWLSSFITRDLARRFVEIELLVALVGGTSAPMLFFAFGSTHAFRPLLFFDVLVIGALVGLELPLLMRILEGELRFKDLVSRSLAFDYAGALVASVLFPIVFVPTLGLVRTAFVMGLVNAAVAIWGTQLLRGHIGPRVTGLRVRSAVVVVLLVVGLIKADALTNIAEERVFAEPIVYAKSTPYQRIVVTQGAAGFAVYLNGNLQLASIDEYRYHEALVHPAMLAARERAGRPPRRVLVLGGGDGLALREIWKHEGVEHVTLVDLDAGMTSLSRDFPPLATLNKDAYADPRLTVVNEDAFLWIDAAPSDPSGKFDVVIVDFPDPNHLALGKLYTRVFYRRLLARTAPLGAIAVQATSPLFVPKSYWTIVTTLEAAGFATLPYHAPVPSFGEWGFVLATPPVGEAETPSLKLAIPDALATQLRFLDAPTLATMFVMPADMARMPAEVNRLDNQVLVRIYEDESAKALR